MSFSKKDRSFRDGSGKAFPAALDGEDYGGSFADVIAVALNADFGLSPAKIKQVARLTGANERTVRNWVYARNGPSGEALVVLMRHSDSVLRAVLNLSGRAELVRAVGVENAKAQLRIIASTLGQLLGSEDG